MSTPFVTVTGTASDALSGLAAVRCNGVLATVSNGHVTCDVPLRAGRNPVVLQASDHAGHSTSVGIVVWRTVAVDRLTLSPQQMTMHEGDETPLRLVNNMGRVQANATWSVDAPSVVEVVEDGEPILRALGPGTAIVTATVGAYTAQSTITVVGQTVVFVPGTTRWLVQVTPGHTLDGVIYTHQTSPDVPEAVLVETLGDDSVQLRGISDGATTSITPVSGPAPFQTMGDSFGGVLLAQQEGETGTALQRVGFTPDVLPWRWVSAGNLAGIVQIHDGTIFATERVSDADGLLSAASIVVLDGATGVVRARVPITASTYDNTIASDGSTASNCGGELPFVQDGIGLSNYWALTTADKYGVVTFERTLLLRHCDGEGPVGSRTDSQHLLEVDRDGGQTTTPLSQKSETYPPTEGGLSMPEVTELAADARGGFVVTLSNLDRQVIGPGAGGTAFPLDANAIVSASGVYVEQRDDSVRAFNIASEGLLWTTPSAGMPFAFPDDGRAAVLTRLSSEIIEVGPSALPGSVMSLSGADSQVTLSAPGLFTYSNGTALVSAIGPNIHSAELSDQGNNTQRQGPKRRHPEFLTIDDAGLAGLREYFPLGMERRIEYGGSICRLPSGKFLNTDANPGPWGEVYVQSCPAGTVHFGEWHTHPPCGYPGPSGPDAARLRQFNLTNPDARGYVGVPHDPLPYAVRYYWPATSDVPISQAIGYLSWPNNRIVPCF